MTTLLTPVGPEDHVLGPDDASVTLVEYGDFECPSCAEAHHQVQQLERVLGDRMRFVFRHFPLSDLHPHALQAAEAAEAAAAQGLFWEMHDTLFENQDLLDSSALLASAQDLGLDAARFALDLSEHRYLAHVRRDFTSGTRSGVRGTPAFFINGVRHDGGYSFESLIEAIRGDGEPVSYGF